MSHLSKQSLQRYATTSPAYQFPSSLAWVSRWARPPQSTHTITSSGGLARPCKPRSSDISVSKTAEKIFSLQQLSLNDQAIDHFDENLSIFVVGYRWLGGEIGDDYSET